MKTLHPDVPQADSSIEADAVRGVRLSLPHLVLAAIGFGLSLYLFNVHRLIVGGGEVGACGSGAFDCDKVLSSRWAEILHIPLGVWGMAFFVIVALTAIVTDAATSPLRSARGRLLVSGGGLLFAGFLIAVSALEIKAFCPYCMATHATTLLIFLVSLSDYFKARRRSAAA